MNHNEMNMRLATTYLDTFLIDLNHYYDDFCLAIKRKKRRNSLLISYRALKLIKNNLDKINDLPNDFKYMVLNFVNAIKFETMPISKNDPLYHWIIEAKEIAFINEYQELKASVDKLHSR